MSKKIPTLAELLYTYPDPMNMEGVVYFYAENIGKIKDVFSKQGITPETYSPPVKDAITGREPGELYAGGLVYEALRSPEERLKTSQRERERSIQFYESIMERIRLILKEPYLCLDLGLSQDELKEKISHSEIALDAIKDKSKRSGQAKTIKYWMGRLVPYLEGFGFGQTKRINFIYDLFVEFEVPYKEGVIFGASHEESEIGPLEQKDRIRKWDEEIMRA